MRIKIILNPTAGRGRGLEAQTIIENKLNSLGLTYDLEKTLGPEHVVNQARRASQSDNYDLIIAAGGDGTINQVVNGMVGSNIPLGVIPCGTGNDFAGMIGMPTDIEEALIQILNGSKLYIDLGKVNNRFFINSVGAGFDGQVAHYVNQGFRFLRGKIVYILSIFKTIFSYSGHQVRITIDGETNEFKALLIAVNNSITYGGGLRITPQAVIDDGYLAVCTAQMMNPVEISMNLPKLVKGTHGKLAKIKLMQAKTVLIESETPLFCQIDGEIEEVRSLKFEILPQAFPIFGSALQPSSLSMTAATAGE
jgi:YegS/Rv2252/BmrU family lipid kinase